MGINVVTFVPEGIVIVSDDWAELKYKDDGFNPSYVNRTFLVKDSFCISFLDAYYPKGMPLGYYILRWQQENKKTHFVNVKSIAENLVSFFHSVDEDYSIRFYIAGYIQDSIVPEIYLVEGQKIIPINRNKSDEHVYNFHVSGRIEWVNKLLYSKSSDKKGNENILTPLMIDFTKYSIKEATEFSKFLIEFSNKFDEFAQFKKSIGSNLTIAILTPNQNAILIDH